MSLKYDHTVVLVDDEQSITKALKRLFRKQGYNILTASSGREGLELLKGSENPVSLIISDQRMPEMTGAQFLEKAKEIYPDAIRFLLTGYSDMDAIVDAVNKGEIHRYLTKPWNDDDMILQVRQSLEQYDLVLENRRLTELTEKQNRELKELNQGLEKKVKERTRKISEKNRELEEANRKLEESVKDTIRLLASQVETLNPRLGQSTRNAAELVRDIAEECELKGEELDQVEMAGMVYDVGLLGLPEKLWAKDEKDMNDTELKMYSQHPVMASMCIETVEKLSRAAEVILYHHEDYNGGGFPNGLKGDEIPLGSRIIKVVADYLRIVNTWPRGFGQISERARKHLGEAANRLPAAEPEEMIRKIAKTFILAGVHTKYDADVVTRLMKKMGETTAAVEEVRVERKRETRHVDLGDLQGGMLVDLGDLKEGMLLAQGLKAPSGMFLLAKGTRLKRTSIRGIQNLGRRQLIGGKILISV